MIRTLCFISFILLSFCLNAQGKDQKDYSDAIKFIEVWLDAQKDFDDLPGISAIAVKDQDVLWKGAFGDANIKNGIASDASTLCSICSISKLFTSIAIMKLYEEGKLSLDDKIQDVLPWFDLEQKFSGSGPITIRSILTHSSGLPREANAAYWSAPDFVFPEEEEFQKGISNLKTLYPSSTYFQYSNLGLSLLGRVVEEVSGMKYEDYVNKNILSPLGLKDTRTFMPQNLYGKKLALGYSALKRNGKRDIMKIFKANAITPAAGFSSNVEDLAKFASWQFRLLNEDAGYEVLKSSTLKYMQNVQWVDPDFNTMWGLGFSVYKGSDGTKWVGHGGSCPGYRTVVSLNPKTKMGYSVMINASGTNPAKYVKGIHSLLSQVKSKSDKDSGNDLSDYVGYFNPQPWSSEMYVGQWEDKLAVLYLPTSSPGSSLFFLEQTDGDEFRRLRDDGELGETFLFLRNKDEEVVQLRRFNNFYSKMDK